QVSVPRGGRSAVLLPHALRCSPGLSGEGTKPLIRLYSFQRDCFYEGYVEGFPVSLVALSTCSGLSGILQLMNASYGIKPLEAAAGYQHLLYPMWNENIKTRLFIENSPSLSPPPQYQRAMTLEAFAVVVARLLGLSLGMAYDDPGSCHCAGAACIMQASLVHLAGVKAFSSCSIRDFQHFLATGGGQCLLNRPAMDTAYKAPVCGNKVVEPGEACDCGTTEVSCGALRDPCCTIGCKLRRGVQCLSGPCCRKCKFVKKGTLCRSSSEDECELKEYCNGTSGECTPDLWVMDGHPCSRNTAFCYQGVCQTANKQCQKVFGRGKGAKNGPLACYEEINSQRDRMGHCGSNRHGYQHCAWK
uniref:ADA32 protein n=1 Tax=Buteo japonicus TaxID=224669 RepID=A0A8C0B6G0_9AVES